VRCGRLDERNLLQWLHNGDDLGPRWAGASSYFSTNLFAIFTAVNRVCDLGWRLAPCRGTRRRRYIVARGQLLSKPTAAVPQRNRPATSRDRHARRGDEGRMYAWLHGARARWARQPSTDPESRPPRPTPFPHRPLPVVHIVPGNGQPASSPCRSRRTPLRCHP
jgi:hypothetical protein